MKLRLAITGSGGYLAQQLIARLGATSGRNSSGEAAQSAAGSQKSSAEASLSADADGEFILGLDIRPRKVQTVCRAEFIRFDITSPWEGLAEVFRSHSINAGLHLAWQFNPIHDLERHRQIDVEGSRNFFKAAEAAGLRRVVYAGSTTAYVNPKNPSEPPFPNEDAPVTGTPRYLYSKHKAEVDRMAQEFMSRHPEVEFTLLRGAIVLGPHTQNIVTKMMDWPWPGFPWLLQVWGADPPMQFLAEEDIGEILFQAVRSGKRGIFNCSGDGVVRFTELVRGAGKAPLPLPVFMLDFLTAALWALRLAPFPAGILDMIRYPWVADNTRLKTSFGYMPRHTSQQALNSFFRSRQGSKAR